MSISPLSACLAIAFPLCSGAAMAQSTFEANGTYDVDGVTGGFTLAAAAGQVSGSDGVGSGAWSYPSASVSSHASGDGRFGGEADTNQSYMSNVHLATNLHMVYRDSINNDTGAAQQASFALHIGGITFNFDRGEEQAGMSLGSNRVSFAANVYLDGSNVLLWSSTFTYDDARPYYGGPASFQQSGADLGLAGQLPMACPNGEPDGQCEFSSGGFGIGDYSTTLALGTVASGQTLGIRYEVDLATETDLYGGDASVIFGDPSKLSSNRLSFDAQDDLPGIDVAAVPEPETYAMLAAGLGLMAVARRRRR